MPTPILLTCGKCQLHGQLNDSPTAKATQIEPDAALFLPAAGITLERRTPCPAVINVQ